MQIKLFKVYKEATISKIQQLYSNCIQVNEGIIGIPYENRRGSYRDLIESIQTLEVKQLILTAETFLNIVTAGIAARHNLLEMDFIESIPQENQEIVTYYKKKISEEQNMIKRKLLVQNFFSELDWIIRKESIDIKKISIGIQGNNEKSIEASLYNNGILFFEDEIILEELVKMLKEVG